jgi:ABC-type transport system involved in multi-copper enzyme maturation permease subunit
MRETFSLIRREFTAYFLSPIAYVVLLFFLAITGYLFFLTVNGLTQSGPRGIEFPFEILLGSPYFWVVFVCVAPALTMRLFAEERATGTLEVLMTSPIRDWQVVLAKFIACFFFYLLLWLPTLAYLPVLLDLHVTWDLSAWSASAIVCVAGLAAFVVGLFGLIFGMNGMLGFFLMLVGAVAAGLGGWAQHTRDGAHLVQIHAGIYAWPVVTSYIGVILAGAMFLSLGLFVSSLVRSQLVAFLIALLLSLLFVVAGFWQPDLDTGGLPYRILYFLSVPLHFSRDFTRGVLDSRHIVLYVSATFLFLFLTVRSLESRRWK